MVGLFFALCGMSRADEASEYPLSGITSKHLGILKENCFDCHNEKKHKGKFRVDDLPLVIKDPQDAERWQKLLNALNAGEMPPEDEKQPPVQVKADLIDDLGLAMVALRQKMGDRHGQIAMSRLNQREYRNTLRELLGVEINVSQLPSDQGLSNYDTDGASLYVSSNQLESYLELGREAVEEAIDRYQARRVSVQHRHQAEQLTAQYKAHFIKRKAAVEWREKLAAAASKPKNKEILNTLKEKDPKRPVKYLPYYRHYDEIAGAPPVPSDPAFRFFDKPERVDQFISSSSSHQHYLSKYLELPAIDTGAFITVPTIHPSIVPTGYIAYNLPADWPPGKYLVRFRVARAENAPEERRFLEFGLRVRNVDLLSAHEVTGTLQDPQTIETSIEITRTHMMSKEDGARQIYLREKGMHHQFHYPRRVFADAKKRNGIGPEYVIWVDWLEVERVTTENQPVPAGMEAAVQLLGAGAGNSVVDDSAVEVVGGVSGRRVRIFNPDAGDQDYLHLREVQIFRGDENVATGGKASQSSTHGNENDRGAHRAIDGSLATSNHTSNNGDPGEWWEVDLGRDVSIDRIVIHNRNDSPTVISRLKNHTVEVFDAAGQRVWKNTLGPEELRAGFADFAVEAFRGERPDDDYVDHLLKVFQKKRSEEGQTHRSALTHTLAIVLSSPMFLYKSEASPADGQTISQRELAQRLSYFLWSAPADKTLLRLADAGKLAEPRILRQQTDRLLNDRRSEAFIHGLVHQWLHLERLDFFNVNLLKHRTFDNTVKMAIRGEVYETFAYLFKHNRNIQDLLDADYAVINNVLGQHYGIPGVSGDHFRRVDLPETSPRGGLLGMAATHVMGGNGDESSPVERGVWVLRKLLHQPPPPAPANVPAISRLSDQPLTTRERLVAHQEKAQCASCHRKIDPIGFGLENFDAVGLWRTKNSYEVPGGDGKGVTKKEWTIDPGGSFHKGPAFADYFELREHIATQSEAFARSFASAVVEYGTGRSIGFSDEALLDAITKEAKAGNNAIRSFTHALVQHKIFQKK